MNIEYVAIYVQKARKQTSTSWFKLQIANKPFMNNYCYFEVCFKRYLRTCILLVTIDVIIKNK